MEEQETGTRVDNSKRKELITAEVPGNLLK
jgi:hypothetical protein